jgi:hypothetical protein
VSQEEALEWLRQQALAQWGPDLEPQLERALETMAEAMAAVSATPIPENVEPL